MTTPHGPVTDTGAMPPYRAAAINALLPILPGDPADYVTDKGRPDFTAIYSAPLSHVSDAAARMIQDLWAGSKDPLGIMLTRADRTNSAHLANALRAVADGLDPA